MIRYEYSSKCFAFRWICRANPAISNIDRDFSSDLKIISPSMLRISGHIIFSSLLKNPVKSRNRRIRSLILHLLLLICRIRFAHPTNYHQKCRIRSLTCSWPILFSPLSRLRYASPKQNPGHFGLSGLHFGIFFCLADYLLSFLPSDILF